MDHPNFEQSSYNRYAYDLYTLTFVMSSSIMSLPLLFLSQNPRERTPSCCHVFFPYITYFDVKIMHRRNKTTLTRIVLSSSSSSSSSSSLLRYFVMSYVILILYYHATRVNTMYLINIMCSLVATCVIVGKLEYNNRLIKTTTTKFT
jgi:hypothetical protein